MDIIVFRWRLYIRATPYTADIIYQERRDEAISQVQIGLHSSSCVYAREAKQPTAQHTTRGGTIIFLKKPVAIRAISL